jgi:hypothetical protein
LPPLAGGVAAVLPLRNAALCRAEQELWAVTLAGIQAFEAEDPLRDPASADPCPEPVGAAGLLDRAVDTVTE